MSTVVPIGERHRIVRRTPCLVAATLSTATVVLLLPVWVVTALVAGAVGLTLLSRARSESAVDRATGVLSLAVGCAVGPVVFLLLAGMLSVTR